MALVTEQALHGVHARLRKIIQHTAVHTGRAPSVRELCACCGDDETRTREALRDLARMHALVLHPPGAAQDEVFIAHPFAFYPTLFQVEYRVPVVEGKKMRVNSPCVWCALGLCSALFRRYGIDSIILTCDGGDMSKPLKIPVRGGNVASECEHWLAHFVIPARNAWDNVVHTCANMLCFTDAEGVAKFRQTREMSANEGDVKTLAETMAMAAGWYGHYLTGEQDEWRKLTSAEVKELFQATGFSNTFWKVWDD